MHLPTQNVLYGFPLTPHHPGRQGTHLGASIERKPPNALEGPNLLTHTREA